MSVSRRRVAPRGPATLAVLLLLVAGCQEPGPRPAESASASTSPPAALRPEWRPVSLPAPPGPAGRLAPRAAAACGDRWYVVGAVTTSAGETRPAAWTSSDTRTWRALRLVPKTYYGERNVLYSAACHSGRLAVVGGKSGGAHGNPRVSSWRAEPDGSLVEITAPFELYGGPQAVNVGRLTSGPPGWLIVGNRMTGAAVWSSPDAGRFAILERAPELASDARGETWAADAVSTPSGWLVVGGLVGAGRTDRDPLAWTSADGRSWRRVVIPGTGDYEELQRVALVDGTPVAVGLHGRGFGAWRAGGGPRVGESGGPRGGGDSLAAWTQVSRFGVAGGSGVPTVRSLVGLDGGALVVAVSDGAEHGLWLSADRGSGWRPVAAPARMPAGAERDVEVASGPGGLLLMVDDARSGQVWFTPAPLPSA